MSKLVKQRVFLAYASLNDNLCHTFYLIMVSLPCQLSTVCLSFVSLLELAIPTSSLVKKFSAQSV